MGTTARDSGNWLRLNLNQGEINGKQIVSPKSMAEMLKVQSKLTNPSGCIRRREGFGLGWWTGTYRGRPYAFHGGGYIGSASYFAFLPEENIGMAIFVNSAGSGHGLTDVISVDIFDKLLGLDEGDLLPSYERRAKSMRDRTPAPMTRDNPTVKGGLSLPTKTYVGTYVNKDWGSVELRLNDGQLVLHNGDLRFELFSTKTDEFTGVAAPSVISPGKFVVNAGHVDAVMFEAFDVTVQFDRN